MKVAKILSTCFRRGRVRENTELVGHPVGYFSHSQNFTTFEDTVELLKYQIEMEKKYPPGINRDLVIVNSDVGSKEGNAFVEKLNNKEINDGKIISFTRKNVGLSYGAYNDAYLMLRNNYDFFLFIEDDLITAKENYLKIGIDQWNKIKNCGFIAYYGLTRVKKSWWDQAGLNKTNAISAYSGCGLSSKIVLDELGLSKSIIDLGFKMTEFKDYVLVIPAYDLMRGIKYKKYPGFFLKYSWIIKSKIYSFFSLSPWLLDFYLKILKKLSSTKNK
jgi:hypothetical protein